MGESLFSGGGSLTFPFRPHRGTNFRRGGKKSISCENHVVYDRCRRLAKDWENLNRNAVAFLKLASIRLMLRKLCNPS